MDEETSTDEQERDIPWIDRIPAALGIRLM